MLKKIKHTEKEVESRISKAFVLPFMPSKCNPYIGVAYLGKEMREYLNRVSYIKFFVRGEVDEEYQLKIHKNPKEFENIATWLSEDMERFQDFVIFVAQDQYKPFLRFLRKRQEFSSSLEINELVNKNSEDGHTESAYLILPDKMNAIYQAPVIAGKSVSYKQKWRIMKDVENDNPLVDISKAKMELWDRTLTLPNSPCVFTLTQATEGKDRDPYFRKRKNFQNKKGALPVKEEKITVEEDNLMLKNLFLLPDCVRN